VKKKRVRFSRSEKGIFARSGLKMKPACSKKGGTAALRGGGGPDTAPKKRVSPHHEKRESWTERHSTRGSASEEDCSGESKIPQESSIRFGIDLNKGEGNENGVTDL